MDDICSGLGISREEAQKYVVQFQQQGVIDSEMKNGVIFFKSRQKPLSHQWGDKIVEIYAQFIDICTQFVKIKAALADKTTVVFLNMLILSYLPKKI